MIRLIVFSICGVLLSQSAHSAEFHSSWSEENDRIWIGPEYWANPMEDWKIQNGLVLCTRSAAQRNIHLLTHQLTSADGGFEMSALLGLQEASQGKGSAGFAVAIRSELGDYRSSLIHGKPALEAGITTSGMLFLGPPGKHKTMPSDVPLSKQGVRLVLAGEMQAAGKYRITLKAVDPKTQTICAGPLAWTGLDAESLQGNVAIVHNFAPLRVRRGQNNWSGYGTRARFWFRQWELSGEKFSAHAEQTFGPILYAMYTLSRGTMKMTVQMPPVGSEDSQIVLLQVPRDVAADFLRVPGTEAKFDAAAHGDWRTIARASIDPLSRTAHFRLPNWPDQRDVPYQIYYDLGERDGEPRFGTFQGTIRKDPRDKPSLSVAGFTGNTDPAFPNALLVANVAKHDPDLLLFTGDQIYENVGGYGIIRYPAQKAVVNYLRKIYLWGWAFRDILKDRPSLVLPDDHDVYQGNIWGEGGKHVPGGIKDHAQGGFVEPADFVNAVFRTQVAHHPDPYDPTPMLQGIDCWYGEMVYGRVSFAILEDRYFKSGPEGKVNDWKGRPDHMKNPEYDVSKLDKPGLVLLGERQLRFLEEWAENWEGADMKCVCSQTIFCNLANYHGGNQEFIFADLDSNGWPQTGRNKALAAMRKGFAFHYAGDQHLPSIVHHGIDAFGDAGWSFCVPSIAAGYPRSWRPDAEGRPVRNRPDPGLPNTGDYLDGFGNKMSVYAIGNPAPKNRQPLLELLHDKSSGYGLVHFNKSDKTIKIECFRLLFDADNVQPGDQFPGWPRTISMYDNYRRKPLGSLRPIQVEGLDNPLIKVTKETSGELVYAVRMPEQPFRPPVFSDEAYRVTVGDPDTGQWKSVARQRLASQADVDPLRFTFD